MTARVLVGLALTACSAPAARPPPTPPAPVTAPVTAIDRPVAATARPRLVVLVVVDQLPQWAFAEKRPHLSGGFARLLREGEWHTGLHPSVATLTAPGHALIGTGVPTATSGILSNEWWHRDGERMRGSVDGVDGAPSAAWLRVPALGDAMAAAGTRGKAVSVSLKPRAAILVLGKAGLPIWYDATTTTFTSRTPPGWLAAHARAHPIAPRLEPWTPLEPARLAALSGTTDDQRGEVGEQGFGPTFPHAPRATQAPAAALLAMPLGNEVVLETALAAIDGEALGRDDAADLLALSLSAHDYVGHGWGHESWEAWDMALRLDAQLARFVAALDAKVGPGRWSLVLTSDHGASPLPERVGGGRITQEAIIDAANRAASTQLGAGTWIATAKYPTLFLSAAARAKPPRQRDKALAKIVHALRAFPGLARVERTADFAGNCAARTGDAAAICLGLDGERSGEVLFLPKRGWILEKETERMATAHGSLYAYDREVPVILLPPGRVAHAPLAAPSGATVPMSSIATVVARWLDIAPPNAR